MEYLSGGDSLSELYRAQVNQHLLPFDLPLKLWPFKAPLRVENLTSEQEVNKSINLFFSSVKKYWWGLTSRDDWNQISASLPITTNVHDGSNNQNRTGAGVYRQRTGGGTIISEASDYSFSSQTDNYKALRLLRIGSCRLSVNVYFSRVLSARYTYKTKSKIV